MKRESLETEVVGYGYACPNCGNLYLYEFEPYFDSWATVCECGIKFNTSREPVCSTDCRYVNNNDRICCSIIGVGQPLPMDALCSVRIVERERKEKEFSSARKAVIEAAFKAEEAGCVTPELSHAVAFLRSLASEGWYDYDCEDEHDPNRD